MGDVHYIYRHGRKIEVKTLDIGPGPAPKKKQHKQEFVLVPKEWLPKLSTMSMGTRWLAVALLWNSWRHYGRPFPCSNSFLNEFGLTRRQKDRGLLELEQAGLITVERAQHRAPRVKITSDRLLKTYNLGCSKRTPRTPLFSFSSLLFFFSFLVINKQD